MAFAKINLVYFSATGTTAKIVSAIGEGVGAAEKTVCKIIHAPREAVSIPGDELTIFGVPVFSGRVPEIAKQALGKIKGDHSPAIVVCVYGNRDFDDALLELRDIVAENGFVAISAAAFVAQHSIFPEVGRGRPDAADLCKAEEFGRESAAAFAAGLTTELAISGNNPYRAVKNVPLTPTTRKKKCDRCGACVKNCPTQAIDANNPSKVDKHRCIACAHCISICPTKAKSFDGLLYALIKGSFEKKNRVRKEPSIFYRR